MLPPESLIRDVHYPTLEYRLGPMYLTNGDLINYINALLAELNRQAGNYTDYINYRNKLVEMQKKLDEP